MKSDKQIIKARLNALANMAIKDISSRKKPVIQFCAPISTGGFGNVADNIENLASFISFFRNSEVEVFDQLKYERMMNEILRGHTTYDYPLLDYFYKPIFTSGFISGLVFLPLWETSIGCKWEYEFAKTVGLHVCIIKNNLESEVNRFYNELIK